MSAFAIIVARRVFVGELDAPHEFFFAPTIKPISHAGFPFHAGNESLSLSFQKILSLLVVCVKHDGKIKAQP